MRDPVWLKTNQPIWHNIERRDCFILTLSRHQNIKTSLNIISKNGWVLPFSLILTPVRKKLQLTVLLDHPVASFQSSTSSRRTRKIETLQYLHIFRRYPVARLFVFLYIVSPTIIITILSSSLQCSVIISALWSFCIIIKSYRKCGNFAL